MLNKLIVLEGTDGAGKSTQTQKVKEYLASKDLKVEYFHFPMYGHNNASDVISSFLRGDLGNIDEVDPYFIGNMYAMDRFLFKKDLEKAIKENDVVLLDRYVFSNLAYQGAKADEAESEKIKNWIHKLEFNFLELPYPDLNIFFDVPIDIAKERLESKRDGKDREYLNGKQDIHEADMEFQSKVRDNYLGLVGAANYQIVSCAHKLGDLKTTWLVLSPEDLFQSYKKYLDYILFNTSF